MSGAIVLREPFAEMNTVLDALRTRNLVPALEWAKRNRENLVLKYRDANDIPYFKPGGVNESSVDRKRQSLANCRRRGHHNGGPFYLEFKLHKLYFVTLLESGNTLEAIQYARHYFPRFTADHEREIQTLMGAVVYANPNRSLRDGPYRHLLDPIHWEEAADLFQREACYLMGLSVESPLTVVVDAGAKALPALLNIKQVMQQRQVAGVWNPSVIDELPIEIDLGVGHRYHSIFACPILKQQSTDNNPPVRLICGHCISQDALKKLSPVHRLKCPYCPVEQNANDARQINF